MLGKTHEVTAPTGLLKVMESAVAGQESVRDSTSQSLYDVSAWTVHPWEGPSKAEPQGAPLQRPAGARLKAPAGPPSDTCFRTQTKGC
jgi:hypothetical protein